MHARLPMLFSITALLVAFLGATPLGRAAYEVVLPRNSVGTLQLKRNAVTARKIAPNSIRAGHVVNGSLLVEDFKPGQIPQGPRGDKGDKGDRGAPGISAYEIVTETLANTNAFFTVIVSCPAGKRVLGGGVTSDVWGLTIGPYVVRSSPNAAGTAWEVWMAYHDASHFARVTAFAVCGTVS